MSMQPSRRAVLGAAALTAVALPVITSCGKATTRYPDAGTVLLPFDDLPDGDTVVIMTAMGDPVVLTREGDTVTALSGVCTHQGCSVRKETDNLLCPCHNSKFDWDGDVISGPAEKPLPPLTVVIENGNVVIAD